MAMQVRNQVAPSKFQVKELLFKILVLGDFGVGKTAIIKRFTEGTFSSHYKLTIGVDFAVKSIVWDDSTKVNLQLWDIAGHERFGSMTRVYYKYAIGAVIVFDLSRPATFESVTKWHSDLLDKVSLADGRHIPVVLMANKSDIPDIMIQPDAISNFAKSNDFTGWFLTSAKEDFNVQTAIQFLVKRILETESHTKMDGMVPKECFQLTSKDDSTTKHKAKNKAQQCCR